MSKTHLSAIAFFSSTFLSKQLLLEILQKYNIKVPKRKKTNKQKLFEMLKTY